MRAVPNADRTRCAEFVDTFNKHCEEFEINTSARVCHFLAQVFFESGALKRIEENLRYSSIRLMQVFPRYFKTMKEADAYAYRPEKIASRVYANRMGNGNEASGDGWKYRGRGIIQLTGKQQYLAYQNSGFCVGNLMAHPDWLLKAPGHTKSAMWFFKANGCNEIADQDTGERVTDGEEIVTSITRKVNGGTNGLADRKFYYRKFRKELGL